VYQGNQKLKGQQLSVQSDINMLLQDAELQVFSQFEQWHSFTDHWPRLKQYLTDNSLDSTKILRQHALMVDGLLSLLDDMAQKYELHLLIIDGSIRVSDLLSDILRTTEVIAQTRGVGSGLCAAGQCIGSDFIQLKFLKTNIEKETQHLVTEINSINNPDLNGYLDGITLNNNVTALAQSIEENILNTKQIKLEAENFFRMATKPIDELAQLFEQIILYSSKEFIQDRK